MLDHLKGIMGLERNEVMMRTLRSRYADYHANKFFKQTVLPVIKDLRMFQKLSMHPLSHAHLHGVPTYTEKELSMTIALIEKFEGVVNDLMNDKMIAEIRDSVSNFKQLTAQATSTLEKTEKLVESSQNDIDAALWMLSDVSNNFNKLATNINGIVGDEKFKVCILRPPMIYGKGSRGNYPTLSKMAQKLPIFPLVDNCRSMLYIGNLVEFVRLMIKNEEEGFFFPQNAQYSNTSRLVQMIAAAHGKKILLVKDCTPPLRLLSHATGIVNKAFGSLAYDMAMSVYKEEYRKYSLEESIRLTEG